MAAVQFSERRTSPRRMDQELQQQLKNGDVVKLSSWMQNQPPQQLRAVVSISTLLSSSPISCKVVGGFHALVEFLLEEMGDGDFETAISYVFNIYRAAGHDINAKLNLKPLGRKRFGTTPLLLAFQLNRLRVATALVAAGADVNSCDRSGFTVFHWLVLSPSIVWSAEFLFQAGADPSAFSLEAPPLIHLAIDEGRLEFVQFALLHGCDVNVSYAYDVIKEEHRTRVDSRRHSGDREVQKETKMLTALSRALRTQKMHAVVFMLRHHNARVSLDDLHFCILEGDTKFACMLINHFDEDTIRNDLVNGEWAILSLGRKAFIISENGEDWRGFTIQLILRYASCGWDVSKHAYSLLRSINGNPLVWLLNSFEMYISTLATHTCLRLCSPEKKSSGDCDLILFVYLVSRLCAAGVDACNFRMERILLIRPCLMVSFPCVLKNLYWAGADFGGVQNIDRIVREWITKSENFLDFSSRLMEFLDWYIQETSQPPTLFGICSRKTRMLLDNQDIKKILVTKLEISPVVVRRICQKFNCGGCCL